MNVADLHSWDVSVAEAQAIQRELARKVRCEPLTMPVRSIAAVDVGFQGAEARAAVVLVSYPGMEVLEVARAVRPVEFPYIPGLLSFREGPVILDAIRRLNGEPDLLMFDGQGRAHPRRLGIASHIGLFVERPSLGCAKSKLVGQYVEPGEEVGAVSDLVDGAAVIGKVVRTRLRAKPVFVSVGHMIDLSASVELVLGTGRGHRLPEPLHDAHRAASFEAGGRHR